MQTVTVIRHEYTGPTRNPHGDTLARLNQQFANVRGPEQVRKCLKAWGLDSQISPRQARFWAESSDTEKRLFCDMGRVSIAYRMNKWADIPREQRNKLWRAVLDATKWGERLKGRF